MLPVRPWSGDGNQSLHTMAAEEVVMRSRKDNWFEVNPYAKRFINTCAVCGAQGYAPQVDDADFAGNEPTVFHRFSREKLRAMLHKYYQPMALDEFGRCDECGV